MAVYARKYRPYDGDSTPSWTRFLILPRYSYEAVFKSKLFVSFLVLSVIPTLVHLILIYVPNNSEFLQRFGVPKEAVLDLFSNYDAKFFMNYLKYQLMFTFVAAFILGPALISADLRNNGLPLYLARPFSRTEYIIGKLSVLILLLSAMMWIPGLLLFGLQCYFGGLDWIKSNWTTGVAIPIASAIWILILCLITLSISAYLKYKPLARLTMLIVFLVFPFFGLVVNQLLRTEYGHLVSVFTMLDRVWASLFDVPPDTTLSAPLAWIALVSFCMFFLLILNRKLRAYEVVS